MDWLNLLLLVALFGITLLLLFRLSERVLSVLVGLIALGLVVLVVAVNVLEAPDMQQTVPQALERTQGVLTVFLAIVSGLAFRLSVSGASNLRLPQRVRQKGPTKSKKNTVTRRPTSGSLTVADLDFQDYDVLDRVGIGGMGSVYRARRKQDGRTVALKVPQEKYLADAKFVKRFYREAEVLKRFNHPNIVKVYDYRMQAPEHYIAMEFLDGESLEDVLDEKSLEFSECVQMLRALADALRHIHMQNVVHRDIKPANVMVIRNPFQDGTLREGGVKLMDFGIAVGKVLTRLTMTGARVGTPIYMAPEQAKGNRVDARSDVYSLGLLAYEMVTGQTAFKGSYEAVVHQQVFESPKPPKQVKMEIPGKLSDLVLHMIEKDPAERPTLDDVIARIDKGVLTDEAFTDSTALVVSIQEKRGMLRVLDLKGKLRLSLRDQKRDSEEGATALPNPPSAIAADSEGYLFLSMLEFRQNQSEAMIRKLDASGEEVLAFGGYGLGEGELLQPISIAINGDNVYVLDAEAQAVNVYNTHGKFKRRFGGRGRGMGRFEKPTIIVASPDGNVYVLDNGTNEVQRFNANGEYQSRYAFRLDRNNEDLRPLDGLGVDPHGSVYIVDHVARKVRKIGADGTPGPTFALETLVGEPTDAPWLLQITESGEIFAVRQGGQVLRTFNNMGDLMTSRDMYAPVMAMTLIGRQQSPHNKPAQASKIHA